MGIVQEKFQKEFAPVDDDNGNTWKSDKSARTKKGIPGREGMKGRDPTSRTMNNAVFTLSLPPGTDMEDQEYTDQRVFRTVTGGTDDVTDNPSGSAWRTGFVPSPMRPTDDQWTNEHVDAFYGDDGGFCERNNNLDRL